MKQFSQRTVSGVLCLTSIFVLVQSSCHSNSEGANRYELKGKAVFGEKRIPFGRILLQPDTEQGNQGPAGVADIREGTFLTRKSKGHVGGPHLVTIIATDGTRPSSPDVDNSLFPPFVISVDLPKENATHDFLVPDKAGLKGVP